MILTPLGAWLSSLTRELNRTNPNLIEHSEQHWSFKSAFPMNLRHGFALRRPPLIGIEPFWS